MEVGRISPTVSHLLSTSPSSQRAGQGDLLIETETAKSSLLVWEGSRRSAQRQSKEGGRVLRSCIKEPGKQSKIKEERRFL